MGHQLGELRHAVEEKVRHSVALCDEIKRAKGCLGEKCLV